MAEAADKPAKITSADVRVALAKAYAAPEYAIMWEVGDATGARHTRFADAVVMSLWPSRGLELWGMEIKVSRADWKREAADPTKAEKIAAYCDRWLVVTAPGVITDASELPPAWGWIEVQGGRLKMLKQPAKTEAKVCDRTFLVALLRRAGTKDEARVEAEVKIRAADQDASFKARVEERAKQMHREHGDLLAKVAAFEKSSGFNLGDWRNGIDEFASGAQLGAAVKAVLKSGVLETYSGLASAANRLRESAARIDKALADLNLPTTGIEHEDA